MDKQEFLALVKEQANLNDSDARRVARAVLLTLRSQLSRIEVIDIDETLPADIDSLWHGGWLQMLMTSLQSLRDLNKDEFVEQVRESADLRTKQEAEDIIRTVFHALKVAIPYQEVEHITNDLADDLQNMWKAA